MVCAWACTDLHKHTHACEHVTSTLSSGIGTELRKHTGLTNVMQNKRCKTHILIHSSEAHLRRFKHSEHVSSWLSHRRTSVGKPGLPGP